MLTFKSLCARICFCTALVSTNLYANGVHTWHHIYAKNSEWEVTLQSINESANFYNEAGNNIRRFTVAEGQPMKFGFAFDKGSDFNLAYTITLVEKKPAAFSSLACVFIVTANAPAQADIRAISYHGATCYSTHEKGKTIDFFVG